MSGVIKGKLSIEEKYATILLVMTPGVWYCFSDYEGCSALPECTGSVSRRLFATLVNKGLVESIPVFEGFMVKKHRITTAGVEWLAVR